MPLVTNIFKVPTSTFFRCFRVNVYLQAEMAKAGHALNNNLCPHFSMSRAELFSVVQYDHPI
jgi:hypothetical protein